jgi:hypothetical protein
MLSTSCEAFHVAVGSGKVNFLIAGNSFDFVGRRAYDFSQPKEVPMSGLKISTHPVKVEVKGRELSAEQVRKALVEAVNKIPEVELQKFHIGQIQIIH